MKPPPPESEDSGQFAFEGLDRVLHEKARLGILSSLVANPEGLLFMELKSLCCLTDGNLSRHVQVLQEAGLVEIWKGTQQKRPQTLVRFTEQGRARFLEYIGLLERIVGDALVASQTNQQVSMRGRAGWDLSSA